MSSILWLGAGGLAGYLLGKHMSGEEPQDEIRKLLHWSSSSTEDVNEWIDNATLNSDDWLDALDLMKGSQAEAEEALELAREHEFTMLERDAKKQLARIQKVFDKLHVIGEHEDEEEEE